MSVSVAIVGRPNVGKSTLFNRLVGKKLALVDDSPGVTRDRREGMGRIGDLTFNLIDTAGYEDADDGSLEARMREQTEQAIQLADVILFMIDARAGVTPMDEHFSRLLRKADKKKSRSWPTNMKANWLMPGFMKPLSSALANPLPFLLNMAWAWPTFITSWPPPSKKRQKT